MTIDWRYTDEQGLGILSVAGYLGPHAVHRFAGAVGWAGARGTGVIILDLSELRGWSVDGQVAITEAARRLAAAGRRLELAAIPADGSLVPTGNCPDIPVHPDLATALSAHRPKDTYVMNDSLPPCPQCSGTYTYELGALLTCPECGHEWSLSEGSTDPVSGGRVIKDSVGNVLTDGDTVTVVKTLKVKGSPTGIKAGTKVRNIRLVDGVDGHDIDCKVDGFGAMQLKSAVVKKA